MQPHLTHPDLWVSETRPVFHLFSLPRAEDHTFFNIQPEYLFRDATSWSLSYTIEQGGKRIILTFGDAETLASLAVLYPQMEELVIENFQSTEADTLALLEGVSFSSLRLVDISAPDLPEWLARVIIRKSTGDIRVNIGSI